MVPRVVACPEDEGVRHTQRPLRRAKPRGALGNRVGQPRDADLSASMAARASIRRPRLAGATSVSASADAGNTNACLTPGTPKFMEGVEQIRQIDDTHVRWTTTIGGKEKEWDADGSIHISDRGRHQMRDFSTANERGPLR